MSASPLTCEFEMVRTVSLPGESRALLWWEGERRTPAERFRSADPGLGAQRRCQLTVTAAETSAACRGTHCRRAGGCSGSPGFTPRAVLPPPHPARQRPWVVEPLGPPPDPATAASAPTVPRPISWLSAWRLRGIRDERGAVSSCHSTWTAVTQAEWKQGQTTERTSRPWLLGDLTCVLFP